MNRTANHRDVRRIMRVLDRATNSVHGEDGNAIRVVASCIVTLHETCENFDGWTEDATRAVVLAHALNAPTGLLSEMARAADDEAKWLEWYDEEGWFENYGFAALRERAA